MTTPPDTAATPPAPTPSRWLGGHRRTLHGAAAGAIGGAAYAHFVGCRTGTCAITSSPLVSALFFGFTGAVIAAPGPRREEIPPGDAPGPASGR
ncbi:MAG TPA: hypothetical protein VFP50_05190 [Anaeromyxobacteraceae bacterium]|nr:hypothetical protein [Anaeromyxobacteraceae bacterium]